MARLRLTIPMLPVVLAAFMLLSPSATIAQTQPAVPQIVVRASAERMVRPDALAIHVGVEARASSHLDAMNEVSRSLARVLEELGKLGIAKSDVQTSQVQFHVSDERNRERFRATNLVRIHLRNPDKAGEVLGQLLASGVNRLHGVRPIVERSDALIKEVRAEAIRKARQEAAETAETAGVQLSRILSINTDVSDGGRPYSGLMMARAEAQAVDVPVEFRNAPIRVIASVAWEINQ